MNNRKSADQQEGKVIKEKTGKGLRRGIKALKEIKNIKQVLIC